MAGAQSLTRRLGAGWSQLFKELSGFGVVGAVSFVVDLGGFQLLYAHAGLDAVPAKLCATLVSMTVAYLGHRYWSFSHRARTGVRREYLSFLLINGVTLLLGLGMVAAVRYPLDQHGTLALQATNIASIVLGTVVRYASYRRWVFPALPPSSEGTGVSGQTRTSRPTSLGTAGS